jgi:hypothetical protein
MTLTILEDTTDSLFLELSGSLDVAGTCEVETRFLAHPDDQATDRSRLFTGNLSRVLRIADDLRGYQGS